MTIIVNGCPKVGCHAACALLDRMGLKRIPGTILAATPEQRPHIAGVEAIQLDALMMFPDNCYMLAHVCDYYAGALGGAPTLLVIRDPRNTLISYQRHRARVDNLNLSTESALENFWGAPFVPTYRGYLGWRGKAAVLRYEDLPHHVVGDGHGIYCRHDRHHNTRTGFPSDYAEYWQGADYRAWRDAGGSELVAEAGYH